MKIEDADNREQYWRALVNDSLKKGHIAASVPVIGLTQSVAIDLAIKLKVSLSIKGAAYIFSEDKEGIVVRQGLKVERH